MVFRVQLFREAFLVLIEAEPMPIEEVLVSDIWSCILLAEVRLRGRVNGVESIVNCVPRERGNTFRSMDESPISRGSPSACPALCSSSYVVKPNLL